MTRRATTRFRHHSAVAVAALVTFLGSLPVATAGWFLAPLPLLPLAVAIWAWRAGTDADTEGLRVRALLGSRRVPWTDVAELVAARDNRVAAVLTDGQVVPLTAVVPADLPRLVAASGQQLSSSAQ